MPSKQEKQRRKALVRSIEEKDRAEAEARLPISKQDLLSLFVYVDDKWDEHGCDHTLRHTLEFIRQKGLPEDQVVDWLIEQGGGCDCEVLANVVEHWIEDHMSVRQWKFEGE